MFFKDVICHLTDYCMAWFPLVDLSSREVMGDFNYRHIPPYMSCWTFTLRNQITSIAIFVTKKHRVP